MCESQAWLPIASLFGLLGCSVPVKLKAQILTTLAAFAKSPEIASSMWFTLEQSQVWCLDHCSCMHACSVSIQEKGSYCCLINESIGGDQPVQR